MDKVEKNVTPSVLSRAISYRQQRLLNRYAGTHSTKYSWNEYWLPSACVRCWFHYYQLADYWVFKVRKCCKPFCHGSSGICQRLMIKTVSWAISTTVCRSDLPTYVNGVKMLGRWTFCTLSFYLQSLSLSLSIWTNIDCVIIVTSFDRETSRSFA